MSKKNDGVMIAAIIGGVILLPKLLATKTGEAAQGALNYFGSGGGDSGFDLTGLFGGIGDLFSNIGGGIGGGGGGFDINAFLDGLGLGGGQGGGGGIFGGGGEQGGVAFDLNAFLASLGIGGGNGGGNGGGGGGGVPASSGGGSGGQPFPTNLPNTIPNILTALGYAGKEIGNLAVKGVAAYAGFKVAQPVLPVVGRGIATVAQTVTRPVASVTGTLATNIARALTSPVSSLPKIGVAGAVIGAGAAGYGLGTLLMQKTPLGRVTGQAAESAGAAFARSALGQKVYGVAQLAPASQSTSDKFLSRYGVTMTQAKTMSTAQLQALLKR